MTLAVNKTQDQNMYPTTVGGRTMGLFKQRYSETITYLIDYSQWLDEGDTIASSIFAISPQTTPAVVISGTTIQDGNQLLFQIDNGKENTRYIVTVEITTSTGQIKSDYFQLNVGTPAGDAMQSGIDTALSAAQTAQLGAETAQTGAETARTGAQTARTGAEIARTGAETAAAAAAAAKGAVETASYFAQTKAGEAQLAESNALLYKNIAVDKAGETLINSTAAGQSASTATTKAAEAAASAASASTSASTATTKAADASTYSSSAATSAATATTKANQASASETNAAASAATATTKASEASASATGAAASATTATAKASESAASATNAASSASIATTKAGEASTSASNAATSANNSANSATAAAGSATSASGSASTATTKASEASASATNAATSAATATTKASEAAASASNAATSSTNAAGSASTATTKANEASSSASSASTSATAAQTAYTGAQAAQAAAESARDATLAAYDSFDDRYLGAKSSDPTVDNDGNPLVGGTLYFNTVSQSMKLYTGSVWVNAYVSGDIALLKTNNLSDLPSASTARSNLGLVAIASSGSASDLTTGTIPAARFPAPTGTTFGGVKALAAASHMFITSIGLDGVPVAAQPAFTDVSGTATVAQGGTGATDAAGARSNLGLTALSTTAPGTGVVTALGVNVGSAGAFVVNGGALGTPASGTLTNCSGLPAAGVTGLATVATSGDYSSLSGLPTLGSLAALSSINNGNWSGTALAVDNGGTGATDASGARSNLGLSIGSNVQAWDADLDAIAALAGTSGLLKKTAANTWALDTTSYLSNGGALGTPSSGTLTNCTGLPAAGVTGLATVAATGAYSDLSGKPTLGTAAALNVGASANNIVQLTSSAKIPALDGSLLTSLSFASVKGLFYKTDVNSVAFTKTGAGTVSIKAGSSVVVATTAVTFSSATAVTMPSLTAGTDYAIYVCTDGTICADSSFTAPSGYTTSNSRQIGGFHYAPGGNATGTSGGDTTPAINAYSLWDLKWRPACSDPRGMALISDGFWCDIYLLGIDHQANGTSKYNVAIADGSSPPKIPTAFGGNGSSTYSSLTWWEAEEVLRAYGKRPLTYDEFAAAMYGTTEATAGGTDPGSTILRNAFTSKWGMMLATGNMWVWGANFGGGAAGASWTANTGGRGSTYQMENAVVLGGYWDNGSNCGSRCSFWLDSPSSSSGSFGARGCCDHLILV